jgi:hypothetical protein
MGQEAPDPKDPAMALERLEALRALGGLSFGRQAAPDLPAGWVWLEARSGGEARRFPVDDEYGDADPRRPLLCLALVLRERDFWRETSDYLEWCADQALEPGHEALRRAYMYLAEAFRWLEACLGPLPPCPAGAMDWELDAGLVQVLRRAG